MKKIIKTLLIEILIFNVVFLSIWYFTDYSLEIYKLIIVILLWILINKFINDWKINNYIFFLENRFDILKEEVIKTYNEMKKIDESGAFESDDEVGKTFDMLKNAIEKLQKTSKNLE